MPEPRRCAQIAPYLPCSSTLVIPVIAGVPSAEVGVPRAGGGAAGPEMLAG